MDLDDVRVRRDQDGRLRQLDHYGSPYTDPEAQEDPIQLAVSYLRENADLFGLSEEAGFGPDALADVTAEPQRRELGDQGQQLRVSETKQLPGSVVVGLAETVYAVPVWQAGVTLRMRQGPLRVTGATNTIRPHLSVDRPDPGARWMPTQIDDGALRTFLADRLLPGVPEEVREEYGRYAREATVNDARFLAYRYRAEDRLDDEQRGPDDPDVLKPLDVPVELPAVDEDIREGEHYIACEVLFTLTHPSLGPVNARMYVEPETGSILHFAFLYAHVDGLVYERDPITEAGSGPTPSSSPSVLNGFRDSVTLPGLTSSSPQELEGEYVKVEDVEDPTVAPPTSTGDFDYSVPSDDFSAVGAYYHSDAAFRMVEDFGFTMSDYFDGTSFPVPVDHRGMASSKCENGNCVNASAPGASSGAGSDGFRYALAEEDTDVGITTSFRVVLHEFGHAILWDNVSDPNFDFAHSCGDTLAAILNDPDSDAPDRFDTFPWADISDRRHDRDPSAGWSWGGSEDTGGYSSEQILSTSLFRAYRYLGGEHPGLAVREFTARYVTYLVLYAVGQLTSSTNPGDPADFVDELISADENTAPFESIPGGWAHKVVRWAFEEQGLYAGDPPEEDVYVDDGRGGEYSPFLNNFWDTTAIYNRLSADGDTNQSHQTPVVGQTNYAYVKVKNRGTQPASNVVVEGYHCKPMAGLTWPTDWQAMSTPSVSVSGTIGPGSTDEKIVGPFEWQPDSTGHECLLMMVESENDPNNDATVDDPIAHWRLVPFDNNIAQRNVAPVAGGGGGSGLAASFRDRSFWVRNPFEHEAQIRVETDLPDFLRRRDWDFDVVGGPVEGFVLGPGEERELTFDVSRGADFTAAEVPAADGPPQLTVRTYADEVLVGGMSYGVDPSLESPPAERAEPEPEGPCEKPGFWNRVLCWILRLIRIFTRRD